jgi:TPR repeat protein
MTANKHGESTANASCPTCQGNEAMRTKIEDEADEKAAKKFRLFIVLYLAYPAIILSLLGVIAIGAYKYFTINDPGDIIATGPEPVWCTPGSTMAGYIPPTSRPRDQYESAIPPGGTMSVTPQVGLPTMGTGVQAAGASARDRIAYYVYVSVRAADGAQDARYERNLIGLSQVEMGVARQRFIERSRKDGRLGFIRLGITQLGGEAYDIAKTNKLTVPFCRPNDFATIDKRQAYVNFAVANYCDTAGATRANDWLLALAKHEDFSDEQIAAMQAEAANYLATDPQACVVQLADEPPPLSSDPDDYEGTEPEPAGEAFSPAPPTEGSGRGRNQSDEERRAALARWYLNAGDAALNSGDIRGARDQWQQAINAGRRFGAQASITAQKRIQTHTLTCHPTSRSAKSISREYEKYSGDLIGVRAIQQALRALGHYDGPINGMLGPMTRAAVRKFQREMAFDETDTLTPRQTVFVICNAAQVARDPGSQNVLGIMYATGLGVRINVDLALEWLRAASSRRHAEATYNLAIIYGTGTVLASYRLCDIPQNLDQADQYLREAADQGYGPAIQAWRRHGDKSQAARWKAIEDELLKDPTFAKARELTPIGKSCFREERRDDSAAAPEPAAAPPAAQSTGQPL